MSKIFLELAKLLVSGVKKVKICILLHVPGKGLNENEPIKSVNVTKFL